MEAPPLGKETRITSEKLVEKASSSRFCAFKGGGEGEVGKDPWLVVVVPTAEEEEEEEEELGLRSSWGAEATELRKTANIVKESSVWDSSS